MLEPWPFGRFLKMEKFYFYRRQSLQLSNLTFRYSPIDVSPITGSVGIEI